MENAHKFLAFKNAFTLLYKMQNFITAAHFARQIVALETTGVSLTTLTCVDFWVEAWHCAPIQKVLLSLPAEGKQRSQVEVWPQRQLIGPRDRIIPVLRPTDLARRQPQRSYGQMPSRLIDLCQVVVQPTSLRNMPALRIGPRFLGP